MVENRGEPSDQQAEVHQGVASYIRLLARLSQLRPSLSYFVVLPFRSVISNSTVILLPAWTSTVT